MKQAKQRVIAIDYFRGLLILAVILNHAMVFSLPFAYLAGASGMWTSAAELFLLLSGITYGIVRAETVKTNFSLALKKTWRRAAQIYAVNILIVFASLFLALLLSSHSITNDVQGSLPGQSGFSMVWSILNYSYSIGWAGFLMYYSIFLLFAPFVQYLLNSRYWPSVPAASGILFLTHSANLLSTSRFNSYCVWQIYFVLGLLIAKFRPVIVPWFYGLGQKTSNFIARAVVGATLLTIIISALLSFNIYPTVYRLTVTGWLPVKSLHAYDGLISHAPFLGKLFMDTRTGILRPLIAVMFLVSGYFIYQKNKQFLLKYSGKFVILMGANTLGLFAAQAITIPLLAALPIQRSLGTNFVLTATLMMTMWVVASRRQLLKRAEAYGQDLKTAFINGKSGYLYRSESDY